MADWPVIGGGQFATQLNPNAATSSVTAASNLACAANSTKSAYAELISSTSEDYIGLFLTFMRQAAATQTNVLIDIAIGAAGSEVVILPNFLMAVGQQMSQASFFLPVKIPAGSRISARGQTGQSSARGVLISVVGVPGDYMAQSFQQINTYGADTANTRGVTIPAGASAHAKGAYAEISSSITDDIKFLILDFAWSEAATGVHRDFLVDIATGAAGSENIIISDLFVWANSFEVVFPPVVALPVQIPVGSRVSARAQQTYDSSDFTIQMAIHGLS